MLITNLHAQNPLITSCCIEGNNIPAKIKITLINGKITTWVNEQIASFIELTAKEGYLNKDGAQKLRNTFKHLMPGLGKSNPPSIAQLSKQYETLYTQIQDCLSKAEASKKKVLILVGEDLQDRASFIFESMILDITCQLGIKNLHTETTYSTLEKIKEAPLYPVSSSNLSYVLKIAEELEFQLTACPSNYNELEKDNYEVLTESLHQLDRHLVCIVNVNHLMDTYQSETIKQNYEILCINVSNIQKEKQAQLSKISSYFKERLGFALDSQQALQMKVKQNPYLLNFNDIKALIDKIKDQLKEALPLKELQKKLPQDQETENKYFLFPLPEKLESLIMTVFEPLNQLLNQNPKDHQTRLKRAQTFQAIMHCKEAFEDYEYVLNDSSASAFHVDIKLNLALIFCYEGESSKAIEIYKNILAERPQEHEAKEMLGILEGHIPGSIPLITTAQFLLSSHPVASFPSIVNNSSRNKSEN